MLRRIHKCANPDPGSPEGIQVQSVNEIAAYLGVNPDTIYKWIDPNGLFAHKVGRLAETRAKLKQELHQALCQTS